jgi:hypothetical protein
MLNTLSTHGFGSFLKTKPLTPLEGQATVLRTKPLCDPSQDDKVGRDKGRRCQNGRRNPISALAVSVKRSKLGGHRDHALHIERLVQRRVFAGPQSATPAYYFEQAAEDGGREQPP